MGEIFNFRRFGKYLVSDMKASFASYGLSMLLISLMGLVVYAGTVIMGLLFNGTWGGPSLGFRCSVFAVSMLVLAVTMPVKCYGQITEKRAGSQWLMVPVSRLEKMLSMVLMTTVIIPAACVLVYGGVDAMLCGLDKTCGQSLVASLIDLRATIAIYNPSMADLGPTLNGLVRQITNPLLYLDDIAGVLLIFLLGAIFFRTGKTVKTIIAYIVLVSVLGVVATSFMSDWMVEAMNGLDTMDSEEVIAEISSLSVVRHAALWDTVTDTLLNIALLTGIWFRIKTLKH